MSKSCQYHGIPVGLCSVPRLSHREGILGYEAEIVESVQYQYKLISNEVELLANFSDPSFIYYIILPLAYSLAPGIGISVLWVSILAETIGSGMKYVFQGNRPYWWVPMNSAIVPNISLTQYPATCQPTPGFPSTHMFVTSAAWWTMISLTSRFMTSCEKKATICFFTITMIILSLGRIFLATNFPHQTIVGILLGLYLSTKFVNKDPIHLPPLNYFIWSIIIITYGQLILYLSPFFGKGIKWSFCHAQMHCQDTDWITLTQAQLNLPFVRASGLLSGAGISMLLMSTVFTRRVEIKLDNPKRIASAAFSILLIAVIRCIFHPIKNNSTHTIYYYLLIFCQFFFISMTVILFVPRFMKLYKK